MEELNKAEQMTKYLGSAITEILGKVPKVLIPCRTNWNKYFLTCLNSHMNLSNNPFLIHKVQYDVLYPLQLEQLKFLWELCLQGINHTHNSTRSAIVRSHNDGCKSWLSVSVLTHPKDISIGLRSELCACQSSSSTPDSIIHVFMDFPLWSFWKRKGRQTVPTKFLEKIPCTGTQHHEPPSIKL